MSKFLEILKVALSDKRYGWEEGTVTFPTPEICEEMIRIQRLSTMGQAAVIKMPPPPKGYYGNEDCLKQWWDRERKEYN